MTKERAFRIGRGSRNRLAQYLDGLIQVRERHAVCGKLAVPAVPPGRSRPLSAAFPSPDARRCCSAAAFPLWAGRTRRCSEGKGGAAMARRSRSQRTAEVRSYCKNGFIEGGTTQGYGIASGASSLRASENWLDYGNGRPIPATERRRRSVLRARSSRPQGSRQP